METLVSAKKKRTATKRWLTRTAKDLDELLESDPISESDLREQLTEFEERLRALDDAQSCVELFIDEEELEQDIEDAANFRKEKRAVFLRGRAYLNSIQKSESSSTVQDEDEIRSITASLRDGTGSANTRLPTIHIDKFSGDYTLWLTFWEQFQAVVDNSPIPAISKFSYLQSLLQGEAASAIKGLSLTTANYETAKEILQKRFGRRERIIFSHVQQLLKNTGSSGSTKDNSSSPCLWKLYDDIQINVRSLANLGVSGEEYGVFLTPLVLNQLPASIRLEWARIGEGKEGDLAFLLNFLYEEIRRRERSQTFSLDAERNNPKEYRPGRNPNKQQGSTASALLTSGPGVKTHTRICVFCKGEHYSDKCQDIRSLNFDERKEKVKRLGLCFVCLGRHLAKDCKKVCYFCKGTHHAILCKNKLKNVETHDPTTDVPDMENPHQGVSYSNTGKRTTLMQVVKIKIDDAEIHVLFDSGSDRSFVEASVAKKLKLNQIGLENLNYSCFGEQNGRKRKQTPTKLFEFGFNGVKMSLLEIPTICPPMFRASVPPDVLLPFENVPFSEDYSKGQNVKIDILVGLDFYWEIVDPNYKTSKGLVAQKTKFGWMLSGFWDNKNAKNTPDSLSMAMFSRTDISEDLVKKMWDLDSIGVTDTERSREMSLECDRSQKIESPDDYTEKSSDSEVLEDFWAGVSIVDGRYQVGLPWKSDDHKEMLVNNVNSAKKRLVALNKKLDLNPELKKRYHDVFVDLEQQNMIEEVNSETETGNPVYYLPHRPVVREESQSTKVRPVFDASAKGENGVSLNDCMEVGPKLMPDLVGILLRFRRWKFGLTADIQKAFLQITLQEDDRDVHRFLLFSDDNQIRHMRFTRVTFGNASSPFMLNATLKLHLSKQKDSVTINELRDNMYVDDWLTGSDEENTLTSVMEEADHVMKQGSFHLTKWASNSPEIDNNLEKTIHNANEDRPVQKVLGVGWNTSNDSFHFSFLSQLTHVVFSKRTLLGMIARIFDPLGFLHPFTITLKIIFQEAWREGYDWDVMLPEAIQDELECWVSGLETISNWSVPRRLSCCNWTALENVELVMFSDASEKAYGSCVYLVSKSDDRADATLIISKARVAPLKKVSLPRLELLAALLGARLLQFVVAALKLPDVPYTCFTDSMITLGWIRGHPSKWKQFVRNRVTEIQALTDSNKWKHCPGKENPADLLTRGVSASCLTSSQVWLKGPEWLILPSSAANEAVGFEPESDEITLSSMSTNTDVGFEPSTALQDDSVARDEERELAEPVCSFVTPDSPVIEFEKFSDFGRLVRVMAYVLKFVKRVRKMKEETGQNSLSEAQNVLFRLIQKEHYDKEIEDLKRVGFVKKGSSLKNLCPFIGEDGLLRVKGRLDNAQDLSYDEKHPIILPKCHLTLLLVRSQHTTLKHAGVNLLITSLRCKYWIVSIRPLAKRVVRFCVKCQRHDSRLLDQCIGPLPEARITQSPPFSVVGIDYCGPLFCSDIPGTKMYILLFTCAVTRAVHLELMDSLTTDDFLLAFKRFASRRAMPAVVFSDNAKTFKRAQKLLREHLGQNMFKWQSQPALAPWWGGFYERMVRTVKSALRKTIGKGFVPKKELETVLIEIESCINSRPLTHTSDNDTYLTPSHFLMGRGCPLSLPEVTTLNQVLDLATLHDYHQLLLDRFWETWRSEYLRALPPLQGKMANKRLKVGSIVLVQDENKKRMLWDLGKVVKIYRGLDGCVRAAQILTKKSCLVRPVQRLVLLELDQGDNLNDETLKLTDNEGAHASATSSPADNSQANASSYVKSPNSGDRVPVLSTDLVTQRVSRSGRIITRPKKFDC